MAGDLVSTAAVFGATGSVPDVISAEQTRIFIGDDHEAQWFSISRAGPT